MSLVLRDYQWDLLTRVRASLNAGNRRVIVQMPTGAGKTLWAAEVLKQTSHNGYSSIFLADRRKLIDQTSEKLTSYGVHHGVIMAGRMLDESAPVQVASIQTLYSRAIQREVMSLPNVQLIIIDEAHKSLGNQYVELIRSHFPEAFVLGLTATPVRSDGRGLNEMYDELVTGPSVKWLTDAGYLVPMRYFSPSTPDMDYLDTIIDNKKGDYNELKLGQYMERNKPLIGDVVKHYQRLASDRQAVVFASSVRHSMYLSDAFNKAGITSEHIDGTTYHMDRLRIFEGVHSGRTRVLTNFGVLIEGWDEPQISAAILARPTKSVSTYLQMAGRVLRPFPGKENAILIDHSGAVQELGFVHEERRWTLEPTDSINANEDPTAAIMDSISNPDEKKDLIVCESCTTVYEGRRKCPACGWEPPKRKSKPGRVLEAELEEIIAISVREDYKLAFYQKALGYERARKVTNGWADKAYRLKFKEAPPETTKVLSPDDEIRKWHQHMIIREKFRNNPRRMKLG